MPLELLNMSIKSDEVQTGSVKLLQTLWLIVFSHWCGTAPLTLQVFLCALPWPGITWGMLISAASAWMVAFSETSLNCTVALRAFRLVKTPATMGVQLPGVGHSLRGHLKCYFKKHLLWGAALWLAVRADLCEEICVFVRAEGYAKQLPRTLMSKYSSFFKKNKWCLLTVDHISGPIKHDRCLLYFFLDFFKTDIAWTHTMSSTHWGHFSGILFLYWVKTKLKSTIILAQ